MKIFVSWSGAQSEAVATALRGWLRKTIHHVDPWMSKSDIQKGSRWNEEIAQNLGLTNFGIICLTPDNLDAPWLLFEAGALSKNTENSRVCTYLFRLTPADVSGPLASFQATRANREDTLKLVQTINAELYDRAIPADDLIEIFDVWWPKLSAALDSIPKSQKPPSPARSDRDILEETLETVRQIATRPADLRTSLDSPMAYFEFARDVARKSMQEITAVDPSTIEKALQAVRARLHEELRRRNEDLPTIEFESIVAAAVEREAVLARGRLAASGVRFSAGQEW